MIAISINNQEVSNIIKNRIAELEENETVRDVWCKFITSLLSNVTIDYEDIETFIDDSYINRYECYTRGDRAEALSYWGRELDDRIAYSDNKGFIVDMY